MGANFNFYTFKDSLGKSAILSSWDAEVDGSLHDSGHMYSGGIGMLGHGIDWQGRVPFDSEEAAEDWLSENHQKWDKAMAVQYREDDVLHRAIGGWCSS